jgi:hypothetical protein
MRNLTLPAKFTKKRYAWLICWAWAGHESSRFSADFYARNPGEFQAFQRPERLIERKQGLWQLMKIFADLF